MRAMAMADMTGRARLRETVGAGLLLLVGLHAAHFSAGGADWSSTLWALYESGLCVALCVGLLVLFREKCPAGNRLAGELASASYGVYIVHLPLVVVAQLALADLGPGLPPLAAWATVSALAVTATFLLAAGLRRLPGLRSVL